MTITTTIRRDNRRRARLARVGDRWSSPVPPRVARHTPKSPRRSSSFWPRRI